MKLLDTFVGKLAHPRVVDDEIRDLDNIVQDVVRLFLQAEVLERLRSETVQIRAVELSAS